MTELSEVIIWASPFLATFSVYAINFFIENARNDIKGVKNSIELVRKDLEDISKKIVKVEKDVEYLKKGTDKPDTMPRKVDAFESRVVEILRKMKEKHK